MPETPNESLIRKLRKAKRWVAVTLTLVLLITFYLGLKSTERPAEPYWTLCIVSFVVLVNLWSPFSKRNIYKEIVEALTIKSIEIDSDGLRLNRTTWSKFIPWNEVTQIEEPATGRGMYVRTHRRFVWYLISRNTDRYEEIKFELIATGIPIVHASAPMNWGAVFPALFCASLLCNILTQDRRILGVNFAFALILGCAGTMLSLPIGDRRFRLRSMLGAFLPAVLSAISFLFPFGFK